MFEYWSIIGAPFSVKKGPICIEEFLRSGKIIYHFRQTMGVTVIILVSEWQFMKNHGYWITL